MTPTSQHPATAGTADLPSSQPGLDADRINLYRHHQCLRALQRGTPQASQDFSGVPRTHQFLDTLMVQTTKIKPALTPTTPSAHSTTTTHPLVVIQRDAQHAVTKSDWIWLVAAVWALTAPRRAVSSALRATVRSSLGAASPCPDSAVRAAA